MALDDFNSIQLMKKLFSECQINEDSSDSVSGDASCAGSSCGPSSIKPTKLEIQKTLENSLLIKIDEDPGLKSMEELEELQKNDDELLDTRKQPNFQIAFKQALTTEDIYLQMGLKTSATSSCEDMIIDIQLSDETVKIDQMELNVEADRVHLQTPLYRLKLLLPHKIHPQNGRATYDSDRKVLKLTLRLNRELDFVNF